MKKMMKKTSKKGEPLLSVNNEQFDNYKEISPQSCKKNLYLKVTYRLKVL